MNKKAYIKWQLKELLPAYIIGFVLIASAFWITITSSSLMPNVYRDTDTEAISRINLSTAYPPLYSILAPAMIFATVLPFACFKYQTNHKASDFFYQIPLKKNELRRINLIINLVILLATITVIYWLGVVIMAIKQGVSNGSMDPYFLEHPYFYNYGYLALFYVVMIAGLSIHYFISSFFISLGTKTIDSIFYLVFGHGVMIGAVETIFLLIAFFSNGWETGSRLTSTYTSISFVETYIDTNYFACFAMGTTFDTYVGFNEARTVCGILYALLGGFVAWYLLFKKKDPSGEFVGKGVPTNKFTFLFPHVFAAMIGILISMASRVLLAYVPLLAMYIVFWAIAYYFCVVFVNGGFHFGKKNWTYYISIVAAVVLLTIICCVYVHVLRASGNY